MIRKLSFTLALVLAACILCIPAAFATEGADERVYLLDAFSDTKLDLKPYEGKALFMNFFTEWCPYCMQEMPDIKKVFDTYSRDELQIILIHVWDGEDESNSESIRQTYGLEELTFFEDEDMMIAGLIGLPGYPTSIFIDNEGYLAAAVPQMMTWEAMSAAIDEMGVAKADAPEAVASK